MSLVPLPADAPARTVPALVELAGSHGAKPILTATSACGEERTIASEELPETVGRAASFLAGEGVEEGTHVGLHLDNESGLEALVFHLALQWLGAVAVPVGTRSSPREVRTVMAHAGIELLVTSAAGHAVAAESAGDGTRILDCRAGLAELIRGAPPRGPASVTESTLADILYTSGTTGQPKGAEFTHGNCISCGMELAVAVGLTADDTYQSAIPYFTSTGAHTNPLLALVAGAHFVLEPRFDQAAALERFHRHGTTVFFGVPSMLTLMVRSGVLPAALPGSLREIVFGGSATTRAGLLALSAAFPGRGLVNLYGQTEGGPGGTVLGPDDTLLKPGSVGRRGNGPNTHFRVVRPDGSEAAVDEVGEIALRSPAVMRGYHRNPEETARTLRQGWLHTTDVGRIDADGYLWFVDRRRDLIIRGGFNISSSEVEAVLREHPGVADAAVVAVPHDVLDEDLHAFVVPTAAGVDVDDLQRFARERLADYKVPRRMELVDELPRGPMGKVLKRELRPS